MNKKPKINQKEVHIMKKIITLIIAALMLVSVFALTGCGSSGVTLEQVKSKGELVIATSPDFPPFEDLVNAEGSVDGVSGIDVDILKVVAEKLGVKLTVKSMDFDAVLAGVQSAKFDIGASGISKNPERAKNMLFSDPYCCASQVIVVKEGSTIKSKADLTGKKVSVQTATTSESLCFDLKLDVGSYASNSDAQLALTTGKVDAWIIDDLTAGEMVASYNSENEDKLVILAEPLSNEETYAFIAAFGSETLIDEVSKIVNELIKDGTMEQIFASYGVPYFAPSNG